eukprot:12229896-Alexandrium_andersonii.AAC.1
MWRPAVGPRLPEQSAGELEPALRAPALQCASAGGLVGLGNQGGAAPAAQRSASSARLWRSDSSLPERGRAV